MDEPVIHHLVISGGGINGFINYTILRDSHRDGYWSMDNIQTIYGTSSGAVVAVLLSLKYDWNTLDDYILKRPWHHIFNFNIHTVLTAFSNRGIFCYENLFQLFLPLFRAKDLSPNITLQEFFEWSGIDLHFFCTELNDGFSQDIDLSHTTHPDWKVMEAVYCSSCMPILFQPYLTPDGKCYVDGGVFLNYPLLPCIAHVGPDEIPHIWGIKRSVNQDIHSDNYRVHSESNLLDTSLIFINKIIERIIHHHQSVSTASPIREIIVPCSVLSLPEIINIIENQEERRKLMETGSTLWQNYYTGKK